MDETHLIREVQQIKLLSESIAKIIESGNDKTKPRHELNQEIEKMNNLNEITRNFLEVVSTKKIINREFLTKINHELRTPLVPILAYTDMLLDSKSDLSDEQRERLERVRSSTIGLVQTIQNLFNEKNFDVTSDKPETDKNHEIHELEQEKKILDKINTSLSDELEQTRKESTEMRTELKDTYHKIRESEQEKFFASRDTQDNQEKNLRLQKKHMLTLALISVAVSAGFVGYSYYENQIVTNNMSQMLKNYNSNYVIQNLQGDTVNTWVAWNIPSDRILHVSVVNTANLSQDKIDAIKDAILSTKTITLDDSLLGKGPKGTSSVYYTGWEGALTEAYSQPTISYIPQKFDISGSSSSSGDIVIILTNDVNPDGLSGLTKSIADGNQILKSKITIYRASELSSGELGAIIRHEFGHAMGLAHSTASEDLMHATIQTDYPYISGCDVDAIVGLYDGKQRSEVICKK